MKMKAFLALTAVLSFGAAAAQGTTTTTAAQAPVISDVPAGHWAKDAVDRLVREGVILGYPDGTYRGNQNLTRYQAAVIIARVLDRVAQNGTAGISDETLTSLQNAVQELAADLAALGVRVSDLEENAATKEDIARIEERLESLNVPGGDGAAAGELATQLTELTTRVDELSSNFDTLRADVDDNASSIAALNDLTVLLNQDILSLQDRVSAIEAGYVERTEFDALGNRVTGVEGRVTTLEQGRVGISGVGFSVEYGATGLISGANGFDIDRLTKNTFAGTALGDNDFRTVDTNTATTNRDRNSSGAVFNVSIGNIVSTETFRVTSATLGIGISNLFGAPDGEDTALYLNNASLNGTTGGNTFALNYHRVDNNFAFNPYFFENSSGDNGDRRGVTLTVNANDLPLAPKLTVVTGTGDVGGGFVDDRYFGIKSDFNIGLGTLGLGYAQTRADDVAPGQDVFGADYNINVFGVGLTGAYVSAFPSDAFRSLDARDQAFYTNANFAVGPVALRASYRAIDPEFGTTAGLNSNKGNYPYNADQVGYGVRGDVTFGIIGLGAYYDTNSPWYSTVTTQDRAGFGVNVAVNNFFRGFSLTGSFENATVEGNQVTSVTSGEDSSGHFIVRNSTYRSRYGATLSHDGAAANALIPNLNLSASYFNNFDDSALVRAYALSDITATASYTGTLGGFTLNPFVRYHEAIASTTGTTRLSTGRNLKYGAQVTSPTFGIAFAPNITGGVASRNTTFYSGGTTSELYASAALNLTQFVAPNTTLSVGYSYYQGTNVNQIATATANDNNVFNSGADTLFTGTGISATSTAAPDRDSTGTVNGVFARLGYGGFTATYGLFNYSGTNNGVANQSGTINGFRVGYNVKF